MTHRSKRAKNGITPASSREGESRRWRNIVERPGTPHQYHHQDSGECFFWPRSRPVGAARPPTRQAFTRAASISSSSLIFLFATEFVVDSFRGFFGFSLGGASSLYGCHGRFRRLSEDVLRGRQRGAGALGLILGDGGFSTTTGLKRPFQRL